MVNLFQGETALQELHQEFEIAVTSLLKLARDTTWNKISNNCKYILSEIKNSDGNILKESRSRIKANNEKIPVSIDEILPTLLSLYYDIYDINLYIHRASKKLTIVDIRYYLKSSIQEAHRSKVQDSKPMLHCKILLPPHSYGTGRKFSINWEHNTFWTRWDSFWASKK